MPKHKTTKMTGFSRKTRERIWERDRGQCIFCRMGYPAAGAGWLDLEVKDIMHFIPRSRSGLGVEENGAVGCRYHHTQLDNGNRGLRGEMLGKFEAYLKGIYPKWSREELVYSKYDFLKEDRYVSEHREV